MLKPQCNYHQVKSNSVIFTCVMTKSISIHEQNIHAWNHHFDFGEMFSRTLIPLDQKFTKPLESYESKQNEKILQSCNKMSLGHETCE